MCPLYLSRLQKFLTGQCLKVMELMKGGVVGEGRGVGLPNRPNVYCAVFVRENQRGNGRIKLYRPNNC